MSSTCVHRASSSPAGGVFEERDGDRDFALDERAARGLIFSVRAAAQDGQWEALYTQQPSKVEKAAGIGGD